VAVHEVSVNVLPEGGPFSESVRTRGP